jgi:hypothetical protein
LGFSYVDSNNPLPLLGSSIPGFLKKPRDNHLKWL